jgi:hypothetical protein
MNFFGLRLDSAADPTIQVLAQKCFEVYRASSPRLLQAGEWHMPFVTDDDKAQITFARKDGYRDTPSIELCLSAARCAHLSYNDLETGQRMTVERALRIYGRLVTSRPIHASPTEHQAQVDTVKGDVTIWRNPYNNVHEAGNLGPGWRQARKMIPDEALPQEYL